MATESLPAWTTRSMAPKWIQSVYSQFPLVRLDPEEYRKSPEHGLCMWISPSDAPSHPYKRAWASSDPSCLRLQLLFLLRQPRLKVSFRPWRNVKSAPSGTLPALHLAAENRLIPSAEIRSWLDSNHPLQGKDKELQGMSSPSAYDTALALAQVVLGNLRSAILAASSSSPEDWYLSFAEPPQLAAGLTMPMPAAFTGDARDIDTDEVVSRGVAALDVLQPYLTDGWALSASHASPLDALIASHLYAVYTLSEDNVLRSALLSRPDLGDYVDRVLTKAGAAVA